MRIAIAGTGRLGTSVLAPLLDSNHEVVAVVLDGRNTRGLRRRFNSFFAPFFISHHSFIGMARRNRIPQFWLDTMSEAALAPLAALNIDILLVSGFAIILKDPLLRLPAIGCVNMHSSLLPRHRGANPFYAVISDGDRSSGISFHVMEAGIDTGPILKQVAFDLEPRETLFTLYDKCCRTATSHVVDLMDEIASHGLVGTPQDLSLATYDKKPTEAGSWIDWTQPADWLERQVRAHESRPLSRFRFENKTVLILKASFDTTPVEEAPGTVIEVQPVPVIATGEGTLILDQAIQTRPVTWVWPHPWSKPKVGDVFPAEDRER